jgi:HlyD family secretion protein
MKIFSFPRRRPKTTVAIVLGVVLVGLGVSRAFSPKQPEYVTATAKVMDIRQTVEAVGTVVSERELELRFSGVGVVSQVFVREGDRVQPGQKLAQLRAGSLGASVAAQAAALEQAKIELKALEQGNRPEDIAISEAQVQNRQAQLDSAKTALKNSEDSVGQSESKLAALKQEANTTLSGQIATAEATFQQQAVSVQNALVTIDEVFSNVNVADAVRKFRQAEDVAILAQKREALAAITQLQTQASSVTDYQLALKSLAKAQMALQQSSTAVNNAYNLVRSLEETVMFSLSDRENFSNKLETSRTQVQTALAALSSAYSGLQSSAATYDTRIVTEESSLSASKSARDRAKSDILTFETALRTEQAALALKKAGARQTDIESARARVRAAQANVARVSADFGDTILRAPIAGTVTAVKIRIGESLPVGAAVTLLGDSPYRVELFASEVDIPKVQRTQSGSIELDAYRGQNIALTVGEVDPSATNVDGVNKYRVKLDFITPPQGLKIGMSGDAEIVTGKRSQVLAVPRRAVLDRPDGTLYVRVIQSGKDPEERTVTIGMEGQSGDIEVLSGLKDGETVIVLTKK